jgi:hypothetical protein
MFLIEIAAPRDALSETDRRDLAGAICEVLVGDQHSVPEETLRRARAMTHVSFRENDGWTTGDGPWTPGQAPPLIATFTVPEAWRAEMSRTAIGAVRRAVNRLDRAHGWQRPHGHLWVNVVGVADASIGMDGRPATADDVVGSMTEEFRARSEPDGAELPEGVAIDPMCGMRVRLGPSAITLDHDGETKAFCAAACRAAYARQHGLPVPA